MAEVDAVAARAQRAQGLAPLYVATFVIAAGNGVVFPLLADLQDEHDLPTYGLGIISGASFIASLIGLLLLSGQADRGRAKLLLLTGLGLSAVSLVLFALSSELWQFTAARALGGLAIGCYTPATRSIVARLDVENVGRNLGRLASTELGGFVAGPVVGAAFASAFNLDAPFWALAVVVTIVFIALARRSIPGGGAVAPGMAAGGVALDLLRYREVVVAALLSLALFLPVGIYDSLWSRYLQDRGASTLFIGVTLTLYGVPFITLASRGGRLADRTGPFRASFACLVLIAPLISLYGIFTIPIAIVSIAFVEAVIQAVAVPASQAAMASACPPERLGAGQGLAGAAGQAGAGIVALSAAPIYEGAGPTFLFSAAALVTLGLGGLAWVLYRRAGPSPSRRTGGSIA
jgi:predicted MFS family arabinose efflux permease